jgi:hypothetical protein
MMANWAAMVVLYLVGIFLTAVVAIPRYGVTAEVIAAQHFKDKGLWPEEPYRVMAFGALYFSGLALLAVVNEWFAIRRARGRDAQPRGAGERRFSDEV